MASAVVLWAALPPLDWWPLAWIAPVGWLSLIRREQLPGRHPYRTLWLVGFVFWMAAIHWLRLPDPATSVGWIALSFYLAFYLPVFIGLSRIAVHQMKIPLILAAPVVWTGLELARAHLLTGFTMGSLGHTQYHWVALIQISDLVGCYGVNFVLMFAAACLAQMVPLEGRRVVVWPVVPMAALLAAVLAYGHWRLSVPPTQPQARIGLIGGSIDIELKYDPEKQAYILDHYLQLSRQAVREAAQRGEKLDLIVWPETMFTEPLTLFDEAPKIPRDFPRPPEQFVPYLNYRAGITQRAIAGTAADLDVPLLLGITTDYFGAERSQSFNSAVFVSRSGEVLGRYDKNHLVMFGEYVPFAWCFPWLEEFTPLPSTSNAGQRAEAFDVAGLRICPSICYETVLPHVIRRQVRQLTAEGREPQVLVNLTNDGWFWGSSELDMHLACGVFRAVECRMPLLIAANTGFSAWIEGDGRIKVQGPRREPMPILAAVGPDPRHSLYLDYGDWFSGGCLAGCLVLATIGLVRRARARRKARLTGPVAK